MFIFTNTTNGQTFNVGVGFFGGFRSAYNNYALSLNLKIKERAEFFISGSGDGWTSGARISFLKNTHWRPYLLLGFNQYFPHNLEYGTDPNYSYYIVNRISYLVPELGIKRNFYADNKAASISIDIYGGISYRLSEGGNNKIILDSGNPISKNKIDRANLVISDGLGISLGVVMYFIKAKNID